MAIHVYLQIDAIKGESQDSGYQGWIELSSASWGVVQGARPYRRAAATQPYSSRHV